MLDRRDEPPPVEHFFYRPLFHGVEWGEAVLARP
jgi:hypothetical protein